MELIQIYIPHLKFWILEILASLCLIELISGIVRNLRLGAGRRWVLIPGLVFFYLLCMGCAVGFGIASQKASGVYHEMTSLPCPQITKDSWKDMPAEKRNNISLSVARNSFLTGGCFRDYIDLGGSLRAYMPSDEDREYRTSFLSSLVQLDQAVTAYFWVGVSWLLIPLLGVGIGFFNLGQRSRGWPL